MRAKRPNWCRTLTSYPNIKTDIKNTGGNWVDEEVVIDNELVTSRKPDDRNAFCKMAIEEFGEGIHQGQTVGSGAGTKERETIGPDGGPGEKRRVDDL